MVPQPEALAAAASTQQDAQEMAGEDLAFRIDWGMGWSRQK